MTRRRIEKSGSAAGPSGEVGLEVVANGRQGLDPGEELGGRGEVEPPGTAAEAGTDAAAGGQPRRRALGGLADGLGAVTATTLPSRGRDVDLGECLDRVADGGGGRRRRGR